MEDLDPRLRGNGASSSERGGAQHQQQRQQQHDAGVSHLRTADSSDVSPPSLGLGASIQQQQATQQPGANATQLSDTNATDGASAATAAAAAALEEEAKKARACEACRGLKVRCEPDPDDETKPCKRCKKAGRNCVVTAPSRKRQKKTDSRVADLEKKIDALTATLQARSGGSNAQQLSGPGHGRDSDIIEDDAPTRSTAPAWGGVPSARTWHASTMASSQDRERHSPSGVPRRTTSMGTTPPSTRAGQKRKDRESIGSPEQLSERTRQAHSHYPSMSYKSRNPDFLERGLITMEQAEQLLRRYIDQMVPHFPAILVTPGTTAAELNKTRPMLFSSIMAAATSYQPVLQRTLQKELMTCFAEKVFLAGEKSLDTVQAILVAVIWYWPPENFEELKFYQLIHTASVMAIDIGLGRRNGSRRTEPPFGLRDPVSKKPPPPDALTLECRRTWLACYLLGTNAAMALHRPVLIRWSLFMEESAELLEKSPDALPSDKSLAQLVWAHKLSEDTGIHFFSEDPEKRISLSDPSIRFLLKGLERELENKRASVPVEKQPPTVSMTFNTVNLYMHELVLNSSSSAEQERPPFSTESLTVSMISADTPPSAAHISALSTCLASIQGVFDIFLSIPIESARCLPVYFFVRVAYALVILIKMAFSAAKPGSELGKVMGPDDMKVQFYLDALVGKFRETSADDKCRPAAKFLIVLAMLRTWVSRQVKDGNIPIASSFAGNTNQPLPPSRHQHQHRDDPNFISPPPHRSSPSQQPASTPLHLLSEVASNRNNSTSGGGGASGGPHPPHLPGPYFNGIQRVPQPFFADDSTAPGAAAADSTSSTASATSGPDINLNNWMQSGLGFAPPLPLDPSIMAGSVDLEGVDFSTAEPWFSDVFTVMPNMENMFYF